MTWRLPKRLPRDGNVVDTRDFNEALMHVVEEDGRLNEHNWNEDLATQLVRDTHIDIDAAFRYEHFGEFIDASESWSSSPEGDFLYANKGWQLVPGMTSSFTTPGGAFYIWASMQFGLGDIATEDLTYTRFAVRLDGAVLPLSVFGDQDFYSSGAMMETGLAGRMMGIDMDHSIPLNAGNHTLEIVADCRALKADDSDLRVVLYSKNMLVWEIW